MTNPPMTQSQKRFNESVGALFGKAPKESHVVFLKSSSDVGVMRNGGKNGARFAPQAFLATFKKFSQTQVLHKWSFAECEVGDQELERENFGLAQAKEEEKIRQAFLQSPNASFWHIGGGHDHVFPFMMALGKRFKRIVTINIDAHADTRTDAEPNSGTPFRQFAENFPGEFYLFQLGLHAFANSESTLSPLTKGHQKAIHKRDLSPSRLDQLFSEIETLIHSETAIVFSIDADALNGHEVPGVSAVNPDGFSRKELLSIWKRYEKLHKSHAPLAGIYELNPVYDTLAGLSMRTLASFVFETLDLKE